MLWLAVSPRGVSKPYFCKSGGALKVETYRQTCAERGWYLLSTLNTRERTYSSGLTWLHAPTPGKPKNFWKGRVSPSSPRTRPPCCPQLRPIEDVWAILKAKTYEGGWEATSELQLKRRIRQSIKALNQEVLKTMMEEVPQRARKAARAGALQFVH